ncbi:hypothetical protein SAMN05444395_11816 [Flavobacterium fryxellicola]|nr:hypothetical protein [Flavobacterium fryxellicola]SHN79804.1 hypothetical protein SAMN05444395_11816 [Flavobacterium fryxellicola]
MNYKHYKSWKKDHKKVIDSLGFFLDKGDTIIKVGGYESKGVEVPYEEKDSIFLDRYKQLVFNNKYQKKEVKLVPRMKIWKDEIKIFLDKSVDKSTSKELVDFVKYLDTQVDSLKISFVKDQEKSNYFIYALGNSDQVNLDPRITKMDGFYLQWDGKQNIYSCSLKINSQQNLSKEQIATNMKINFVRSLGYFYQDFDTFDCTSYFSACKSDQKEFDPKDLEILKYHYSYGICKGTNIETFEKNHKEAKESLKKGNTKIFFIHE